MRINSTLYYVLKDHLGSASVVTNASGTILGENRYYPFGETRLTTGTIYTDKLFTGQREMVGLGIYHYQARFYSPKLGRFLSADTIVPSYANPQNLYRYSYVLGNPLKYTDPTGHMQYEDDKYTDHDGKCDNNGKACFDMKEKIKKKQDKPGREPNEPDLGGGHPLAAPNPDDIIGCSLFDCVLSGVSLIATVVAAVPGTIGLVGLGVDVVATVWAIGRTNDDYRQGEISKTRKYALNITGGVGVLPGRLLGEWAFPVAFVAGLANLIMTATGLPN